MTTPTPGAAVLVRVKALASTDKRPLVADDLVESIVQGFPLPDAEGRRIRDTDWTATWDVYAAVAELWRLKAGLVAADFDFSADDGNYSKGEVMAKMLEMEATYAAKAIGSTDTSRYSVDPVYGVVVNG